LSKPTVTGRNWLKIDSAFLVIIILLF